MKDVLKVEKVLEREFYGGRGGARAKRAPAKDDHYTVICISLYNEDLERLDAKVAELKRAGHRKINRSSLIRFALDQVDTTKLPRSY